MIGFLYRWIVGSFFICQHKWKIIQCIQIVNEDDACIGNKIILQCEKCGDIKTKRI